MAAVAVVPETAAAAPDAAAEIPADAATGATQGAADSNKP